jgi:hypothetical protein
LVVDAAIVVVLPGRVEGDGVIDGSCIGVLSMIKNLQTREEKNKHDLFLFHLLFSMMMVFIYFLFEKQSINKDDSRVYLWALR